MKNYKLMLTLSLITIFACELTNAQVRPDLTLIDENMYNKIYSISFSKDGTKLFTCAENGIVWDVRTGEKLLIMPSVRIACAAFSHDGSMIVGGRSHRYTRIWNAKTGDLLYSNQGAPDPRGPISIFDVAFTLNDDKVLIIDEDFHLEEWDYKTNKVRFLTVLDGFYNKIQILKQNNIAFISHQIVSLENGGVIRTIEEGGGGVYVEDQNRIYALKAFTTGGYHYKIVAFDTNNYQKVDEYSSFKTDSRVIKISPNGKHVLLGRPKDANEPTRLIENITGKEIRRFANNKDIMEPVDKIVFSPDGNKVAIVSGYTVNLYDISDLTAGARNAESLNP